MYLEAAAAQGAGRQDGTICGKIAEPCGDSRGHVPQKLKSISARFLDQHLNTAPLADAVCIKTVSQANDKDVGV